MTDNDSLPGLPATIDVSSEELERVKDLPLRAQQIGALLSCGFSPGDIERAFSLSPNTASVYKHQYFTKKNLDISPTTRDKILAAYFRSKSVEALTHLTGDKLASAGAGEIAKTANILMDRAAKLEDNFTGPDRAQVLSNALSLLAQQSQAQRVTKEITDK